MLEGKSDSVQITAGTVSTVLDLRGYGRGAWLCPTGWGGGAVTFQIAEDVDGTFQPAYAAGGSIVTITPTADRWYPIPDEVMNARAVKFVAAVSTTAEIVAVLKE